MIKRSKVTVVGAGNVGGTTAQRLAEKEIADVVLVDIAPGLPQGKALDLSQSAPIYHYDTRLIGTNGYEETAQSDIVIITSGVPRKPGMSREDLLRVNVGIVKSVTESVIQKSPEAILLVVSNPLDAMTYVAHRVSRFSRERVFGMAGVLDSARFRSFIAAELNVSVENVHAFVLGGHGDQMVPLARYTTVGGIPVTELIPKDRLDAMIQRTRDGGAEIVKLLKTGSAYFAPSAAIVEMVESIIKDKKKILPCAALCQGEYKVNNLFVGVPVKLGQGGVEKIIEIQLTAEEEVGFRRSTEAVQELCGAVDKILSLPS
ncbi:MAG TPA: malate dehydrogenase [Candidatus Manganitrophaceae bacterium]|nr:malate dehydrogenase [Candidatus Manganitrophaceae bacterium]